MRSRRRRLRGRFQRARDARLRDGNVGGPREPARGSLQKSASWSARTRARKFDMRAAPHAAPGQSPTHVPLKKGSHDEVVGTGRPGRGGQRPASLSMASPMRALV